MDHATNATELTDPRNGEPVATDPPDRQAQPVTDEPRARLAFPVVAIGASAGGLDAFTTFLKAMRPDSGMAFILILHLPPRHESMLAEILARATAMPVIEVVDGLPVEPNHVYVIRPGHTLTVHDGTLRLGASVEGFGHRRPVDDLFRSLADEQRNRAIGVVMSGMGSNGTAGAQVIKAVGGLCIAQDPESVRFPSMPRSLIDAGLADFVLRAEEIPAALERYARHPYTRDEVDPGTLVQTAQQSLNDILAVLRGRGRHDFSGYKKATVVRRIQRRMGVHQVHDLQEYARLLRQSPAEVTALCDDLMIHVTGFFRDPEAWEALRQQVIVPLIGERQEGSEVRAWVTACSSGEEAYTVAMLLVEAAEAANKPLDIKVFATDTAERSLASARTGIYPGGIESEIAPARLARFFEKDESVFRIRKDLRELVVFAPQNVLQDPPFSRLDLCTCRNLLIYLEPAMQQRVLALAHFGLREGGVLFLGTSETAAPGDGLFEAIDKRWRIYRRIGPTRHGGADFPLPAPAIGAQRGPDAVISAAEPRALPRVSVAHIAERALLERCTPAALVVDREHRVVYFHGNTEPYILQPAGEPTRDLMKLLREPLHGAVRSAMHKAQAQNAPVPVRDGVVQTPRGPRRLQVTVTPINQRPVGELLLITFEELIEPDPVDAATPTSAMNRRALEMELQRVRDELQTTIEELQSSNEEMRASNEEAMSVNEELQSTNEELETSKEELQSLNEELTTVNAQLHAKMEELSRTTSDLSSLLSSTDIAVVFLDNHFRIRRFTPAVKDLLELIPSDIGRPLSDLNRKFDDPRLLEDSTAVLERLIPIEREIVSHSNRRYSRRVLPYRSADDRISGIVITFVDVSERRRAEERLLLAAEASGVGDFELLLPERRLRLSPRAREIFALPTETADEPALMATIHPDDRPAVAHAIEKSLDPAGNGNFLVEFRVPQRDGRILWLESRGRAAFCGEDAERRAILLCGTVLDISGRKQVEHQLAAARDIAEHASQAKDRFLAALSHELRTPLTPVVLALGQIQSGNGLSAETREAIGVIRRNVELEVRLIDDLLDLSRAISGKLRLELKPLHLHQVIRGVMEMVAGDTTARRLLVSTDLAAGHDVVLADEVRASQIIWNLVRNATKFTPEGGRIVIETTNRDSELIVRVRDSGVGITADLLTRLFAPFQQGDEMMVRRSGGLGLGLSITRSLVQAHGGTIQAFSDGPGQGATFEVRLPLSQDAVPEAPPEDTALPQQLPPQHILLVEDHPETASLLARLLRKQGHRVEVAGSVQGGVKVAAAERIDLLISDMGLPDGSGNDLLTQIRSLYPVTAIVLSGYGTEEDMARSRAAGFCEHLVKPVTPAALAAAIRRVTTASGR